MCYLWLVWFACARCSAAFGWLLASLYFFRWIDRWPFIFGTLASFALFPVVLYGLVWIRRRSLGPDRASVPGPVMIRRAGRSEGGDRRRAFALLAARAAGRRRPGCTVWRARLGACANCRSSTPGYRLLSDENRLSVQLVAPAAARSTTGSACRSPRTERTSACSSCRPSARISVARSTRSPALSRFGMPTGTACCGTRGARAAISRSSSPRASLAAICAAQCD